MTVTNTSLLGLALPTTGTESGVWGDDVNNGLTILIDVSVAGTNNITQDSDITLSVSNGNNSSTFTSTATNSTVAQYSTLNCTGARGAIRNIIAPASSRTFVVINNTTGGFAIVIKKSGGTGVSIAPNETAIVYYDSVTATDYVKVSSTVNVSSFSAGTTGFTPSTATTGAVTLSGTLATTNGGTGLTSFTANGVVYASSTSALATGSVLQFDGTNLSLGTSPSSVGGYKVFSINNATGGLIDFRVNGTSTGYVYTDSAGLKIEGVSTNPIIFKSNGAEAGRFTSAGYLGIGTSSPGSKLSVNTTVYSAVTNGEQVLIEGTSAWQQGLALSMWSAGVYNSGYASGYIGIPNTANQIYISGGAAVINNTASGGWAKALNTTSASFIVVGNGATSFYGNTGLTANTAYTPTQLMTLDNSGNLLVGTTNNQGTGRISLYPTSGGTTCISTQSTASTYYVGIWYTSTSTLAGYISVSGGATSYSTSSDYRLKNTIAPMTGALAKVSQLKPVTFKWNADGSDSQGFIAHELQAIVPECVTGEKDAVDAEGNPKYQGIDTSFLVATLTAAIQELSAKVTALEAKLGV